MLPGEERSFSMPTYNYQCDACKHEFEREQRISEPPLKKCPRCGRRRSRRMITNGNFILKGGGWYADGYGAGSKKNGESRQDRARSEKDAASEPSAKGESSKAGEPAKTPNHSASSHAST